MMNANEHLVAVWLTEKQWEIVDSALSFTMRVAEDDDPEVIRQAQDAIEKAIHTSRIPWGWRGEQE